MYIVVPTPSVLVKALRMLGSKWEYKFILREKCYQEHPGGPQGKG